jgi:hypothetical protein
MSKEEFGNRCQLCNKYRKCRMFPFPVGGKHRRLCEECWEKLSVARLHRIGFRISELEAKNQELAEENERLEKLNRRLVEFIEKHFDEHLEVEGDPWFSCPKSDNYCGPLRDGPVETLPCECGKDEADALLAELKGE